MILLHQRKTRKKSPKITLMIVPGSASKPWKVTLTNKTFKGVLGIVTIIIILAIISSCMAFSKQADFRRVNDIKQENIDKDKTILELQKQMREIKNQQETLAKRQTQIQKMMGIKGDAGTTVAPNRGVIREETGREVLREATTVKGDLAAQTRKLDGYMDTVKKDLRYFCARPNQWPCSGEISSLYGWRISPFSRGSDSFHDGIDIASSVGSPILAAGDGTVVFSGWKAVYGKTVEIDHGYGIISKYGHNSQLLVKEGDRVKKGDEIATMGTTGWSTGPHLHFTIIEEGATQDPETYLP